MEKYQNIMVMGAGAVGGYFGGRIAERTSSRVTLIARGNHLKAIQKNGLQLKSIDGDALISVEAIDDPGETAPPVLILFTVKSYSTEQAIEQIRPVVNEGTQILTIQNGIENYPGLTEAFGEDRVIQGFCKIGAGISSPGIIEHKGFGEITTGEKDGKVSNRLEALEKLFEEADIPLHITADIDRKVWQKFAWNCVFNMLTAVGGVTVEKLFIEPETEKLCYRIFEELQQVARQEGIQLTDKDGREMIESGRKLTGFTTSTYQDRMKGKPLEYEAFTGAIIRLADKHGLNVPYNRTLYALLKLISVAEY